MIKSIISIPVNLPYTFKVDKAKRSVLREIVKCMVNHHYNLFDLYVGYTPSSHESMKAP